jgi:hypothetical protein
VYRDGVCGVEQVAVVVLYTSLVDIGTHLQERGKISMISMDFSRFAFSEQTTG